MIIKLITRYFDKLEDKVRMRLSHRSIIYAIIGGTGTILLWRGVWHTADFLAAQGGIWAAIFYEPVTIIWCSILLLLTGLFVSQFIGERIILSGIKNEKKSTDKTEGEVKQEEIEIRDVMAKLDRLSAEISEIKNVLSHK